ncbi:MAG: EamA family transporter [Actinomycetales bacterium]|nr:EamA family transporter [Actinomycetales bacterium]
MTAAPVAARRPAIGYAASLTGALLFGANGSLTKLIIDSGITALQLTQFRTLGAALLAGFALLVVDRRAFRLPLRRLLWMVVLGVAGFAVLQASYAWALSLLPVGVTLLIEYLAVLLVALVALVVFRERVRARLWVAIACVLAGLLLVAQPWSATLDPVGVLAAAGAMLALTAYFVIGERQVGATSPLVVAFWTALVAGLFWAPFSGWWELDPAALGAPLAIGGQWGATTLPVWLGLVVTIALGSFAPFLLSFVALRHLSATAAGVVASSEVIFGFAVAWLWLGEALAALPLAGAAIVLAGIVIAQTARGGRVVDADLALPPTGELPVPVATVTGPISTVTAIPPPPPGEIPIADGAEVGTEVGPAVDADVGGRT